MKDKHTSDHKSILPRLVLLLLPASSIILYVILDKASNIADAKVGGDVYREWGLALLVLIILFIIFSVIIISKSRLWPKALYVASVIINIIIAVMLSYTLLLIGKGSFQF